MLTNSLFILLGLVIGAIASFFFTRSKIQKHLKNNPPITAKQIRAMYISMGRKPSEAQVQKTLKSMNIKDTSGPSANAVAAKKAPAKKGPIGNKKKKKKK